MNSVKCKSARRKAGLQNPPPPASTLKDHTRPHKLLNESAGFRGKGRTPPPTTGQAVAQEQGCMGACWWACVLKMGSELTRDEHLPCVKCWAEIL